MPNQRILIGLAGGTGSGKTSVARKITEKFDLTSDHSEVVLIEQDAYYKDLAHLPLEERGKTNFDHPDSIDFDLMKLHIKKLLAGETVDVPIYDFKTHSRSGQFQHLESQHIVVLEGIFGLYDADIRAMMDIKIYVDADSDIRLLRRLTRDLQERGRSLESVIEQYLTTVRPMHEQFVEPTKRFADIIIPQGGHNAVAIDLVQTKIASLLSKINN